MNKKVYIVAIAVALFFVLYSCLFLSRNKEIMPNEAEKLCYSVLGEKDEETGFSFSFGVTQTVEKEKKKYYVVRAAWLVNNSHMSYIGDFFVSLDGKEIYDGVVRGDEFEIGKLIWREGLDEK